MKRQSSISKNIISKHISKKQATINKSIADGSLDIKCKISTYKSLKQLDPRVLYKKRRMSRIRKKSTRDEHNKHNKHNKRKQLRKSRSLPDHIIDLKTQNMVMCNRSVVHNIDIHASFDFRKERSCAFQCDIGHINESNMPNILKVVETHIKGYYKRTLMAIIGNKGCYGIQDGEGVMWYTPDGKPYAFE